MNHWDTVKKVRGIYKVTNKINGKVYIGQSVDIGRRWHQHMTAEDDIYFHKAIQKYGVENFEWEVIEQCKKKDLDEREIYWIEYYDSFNNGYNCTKGGGGCNGAPLHQCSGEANSNWKGGISLDPEYSKQWYEVNKEKMKEKMKKYYKTNKEKRKEQMKEYSKANKDKIKEYDKQYYEENKEKRKQQMKEHYETNKEKRKEYYEVNKEKIKEKKKEYYEVNKEKIKQQMKEYNKQYYEAHKEELKEKRKQRNKKSMKNTLFN